MNSSLYCAPPRVSARAAGSNAPTAAVCPGPTNTQLLRDVAPQIPKLIEALTRAVPFGRIGEPHEIAAAVAFLASDDAGFITGQTLSVSGGLTMV